MNNFLIASDLFPKLKEASLEVYGMFPQPNSPPLCTQSRPCRVCRHMQPPFICSVLELRSVSRQVGVNASQQNYFSVVTGVLSHALTRVSSSISAFFSVRTANLSCLFYNYVAYFTLILLILRTIAPWSLTSSCRLMGLFDSAIAKFKIALRLLKVTAAFGRRNGFERVMSNFRFRCMGCQEAV